MSDRIITGLYVPGDRPDRFEKAVATGAQLVIIDLEDAVAPARKELAREETVAWLTGRDRERGPVLQVRVNAGDDADLAALSAASVPVEIRLPKVESTSDLDRVASLIGDLPITALIETAAGVENAAAIAAHPAVTRIALGESDLTSDLGSTDAVLIDYLRARILIAARAAGLAAPMLSAYPGIPDLDGLRADTERGRALGWVGRAAVHPSQLGVIAEVFAPRESELARARQVLAAMETGGVATLASGEMVDAAMVRRARALLGD
jgi:citrate lyase subunit beta/citryl-CoA lyase